MTLRERDIERKRDKEILRERDIERKRDKEILRERDIEMKRHRMRERATERNT